MRLSDGERERLFETLKLHAAAGRLGVEELERRVAVVALAEDHEQAALALADLPPVPAPGTGSPAPRSRPRWRAGHGESDRPAPDWRPTQERFRDPRTQKVMRVWEDASGGRHYLSDEPS